MFWWWPGSKEEEGRLPTNFAWLAGHRVAGSSVPLTLGHLQEMVREGVAHLVSLSPEDPPPSARVRGLTVTYIPVEDFASPTIKQIRSFLCTCGKAARRGQGVAVHCRGGNGRTGTMLVAFLMAREGMGVREALGEVRRSRPRAVESREQMEGLAAFKEFLEQEKLGGKGNRVWSIVTLLFIVLLIMFRLFWPHFISIDI